MSIIVILNVLFGFLVIDLIYIRHRFWHEVIKCDKDTSEENRACIFKHLIPLCLRLLTSMSSEIVQSNMYS